MATPGLNPDSQRPLPGSQKPVEGLEGITTPTPKTAPAHQELANTPIKAIPISESQTLISKGSEHIHGAITQGGEAEEKADAAVLAGTPKPLEAEITARTSRETEKSTSKTKEHDPRITELPYYHKDLSEKQAKEKLEGLQGIGKFILSPSTKYGKQGYHLVTYRGLEGGRIEQEFVKFEPGQGWTRNLEYKPGLLLNLVDLGTSKANYSLAELYPGLQGVASEIERKKTDAAKPTEQKPAKTVPLPLSTTQVETKTKASASAEPKLDQKTFETGLQDIIDPKLGETVKRIKNAVSGGYGYINITETFIERHPNKILFEGYLERVDKHGGIKSIKTHRDYPNEFIIELNATRHEKYPMRSTYLRITEQDIQEIESIKKQDAEKRLKHERISFETGLVTVHGVKQNKHCPSASQNEQCLFCFTP